MNEETTPTPDAPNVAPETIADDAPDGGKVAEAAPVGQEPQDSLDVNQDTAP